jgi:hypothetical protein
VEKAGVLREAFSPEKPQKEGSGAEDSQEAPEDDDPPQTAVAQAGTPGDAAGTCLVG